MITRGLRFTLLFVVGALGASLIAFDYADTRSRSVEACEAIDPSQSKSGLIFNVGFGGQGGYWSPSFIDGVFPVRERSQSITRQVAF